MIKLEGLPEGTDVWSYFQTQLREVYGIEADRQQVKMVGYAFLYDATEHTLQELLRGMRVLLPPAIQREGLDALKGAELPLQVEVTKHD